MGVQKALFPIPSGPISTELTSAHSYVRTITSNITSTKPAEAKGKAKGKSVAYNDNKPERLTIFEIKRMLQMETSKKVFDRKLVFDEVSTLKGVISGIAKMTGAVEVRVVVIGGNGRGRGLMVVVTRQWTF
ncbi:hypothetical protein HOY82DRAFT_614825 [Tuber indicum]|nr:hypothetical protein HOY82DRAFT_614825 [Tuber indicum]